MMNKKLFKKQMLTIVITIMVMILIAMFANYLKIYGFGKLFTTNLYEEAFAVTEYDRYLIKMFASVAELSTLIGCYFTLQYNKEIADIEREEELFFKNFEGGEL